MVCGWAVRRALPSCGLLLLTSCAAPVPAPPMPSAVGESDIVIGTDLVIESEVLGELRSISVCLPWGYEQREDDFPAVYLIDGGAQQDLVRCAPPDQCRGWRWPCPGRRRHLAWLPG